MDTHAEGRALTAAEEFDHQLEAQAHNFALMLPKHVSLDKFKRVVVMACIQDAKLFAADRRSLFTAAQKCASDGLLPDGREAVLLPFNSKTRVRLKDGTYKEVWRDLVQYIPMIQGIRTRMRNTGLVANGEAYIVHRNDKFYQKFGSDPQIVHEPPALGTPRGEVVGAYAIIRLTSGEVIQEVMDRDEIERVRSFSKAKDGPAWRHHWGEMARKTVLRRAAKSAPSSAEMARLLERDDDAPERDMVDVTGAAFDGDPEPDREMLDAPTYSVTDTDGELHEFSTPASAVQALAAVFDDAERRGPKARDAALENNRQTLDTIRQANPELLRELDPFGLPPAPAAAPNSEAGAQDGKENARASDGPPASEPSPRDEDFWAHPSLTLGAAMDPQKFQAKMHARIREARTWGEILALRDDNGEVIDTLPRAYRDDVLGELMDREVELRALDPAQA